MKTGFICDSGFNVVASATREGHKLIAVVLGEATGGERTVRAANLLEHGFQTLKWKELFAAPDPRHDAHRRGCQGSHDHASVCRFVRMRHRRPPRRGQGAQEEGTGKGCLGKGEEGAGQEGQIGTKVLRRHALIAAAGDPALDDQLELAPRIWTAWSGGRGLLAGRRRVFLGGLLLRPRQGWQRLGPPVQVGSSRSRRAPYFALGCNLAGNRHQREESQEADRFWKRLQLSSRPPKSRCHDQRRPQNATRRPPRGLLTQPAYPLLAQFSLCSVPARPVSTINRGDQPGPGAGVDLASILLFSL